jgi:cyclase
MLKTRIIPTLLCRGRELVKGQRFDSTRRVGNAMQAAKVHNMRGVDELVILEVGGGLIDSDTVNALASECFMPLSVGGGIKTLEDIHWLLGAGADKVVLCQAAWDDPPLIRAANRKFGAQAVVVAVNAWRDGIRINGCEIGISPVRWAYDAEGCGAGEILLQSVDRDGTMQGYDLDLIRAVSEAVSIPVIASGGCSGYENMAEALTVGAHAVAAGALFQFTDSTPQGAAQYLHDRGFHTRLAA